MSGQELQRIEVLSEAQPPIKLGPPIAPSPSDPAGCGSRARRAPWPGSRFLNRFNEKFSVQAAKPEDLHRRLNLSADRLSDILCHREQRHVGQQLTLAYDRKQLIAVRCQPWMARS